MSWTLMVSVLRTRTFWPTSKVNAGPGSAARCVSLSFRVSLMSQPPNATMGSSPIVTTIGTPSTLGGIATPVRA